MQFEWINGNGSARLGVVYGIDKYSERRFQLMAVDGSSQMLNRARLDDSARFPSHVVLLR